MNFAKRSLLACIMAAVTFTLSACGGGGGGSSSSGGTSEPVQGLEMPTKLSVVAAQTDSAAKPSTHNPLTGVISTNVSPTNTLPTTSAYNTDESHVWVYDPSMEGLSMVNEILCYVKQTGAKEMVNQGAYVALINEDKCQEGQNQSGATSGGGQTSTTSATQQTSYARWVIESTRTDNSSPQFVKIWVPGDSGGKDPMDNQRILVETTIYEGVSDSNPFGKFTMNFKGIIPSADIPGGAPPGAPDEITVMNGTLKTLDNSSGTPQYSFINLAGQAMTDSIYAQNMPFSMVEKSNVLMDDASGNSGTAVTGFSEWFDENGDGVQNTGDWTETAQFAVAFDSSLFLRGKDPTGGSNYTDTVCTDRNSFNTQTWRYNLYNEADGARVSLNSGFPITYTDPGGAIHHGHVGYWGVWLEDQNGTSPSSLDGMIVTKEVFGPDAGTPPPSYTVNVSGGKLWKRTRQAATFAELVGVDMNWYGDPADPWCQNGNPCPNQGDYRAKVVDVNGDGSLYQVMVTDTIIWGNFGPELTSLTTPIDITPTQTWDQLWMWSDTLGGSVVASTDKVVFYKEEVVNANSIALANNTTLYCYENCPIGGIDPTTVNNEADLFYVTWNDGTQGPFTYTVQVDTSTGGIELVDGVTQLPVVLGAGIDWTTWQENWYQWGLQSGEMVTADPGPSNFWDIYNPNSSYSVTYRWETGENEWNRQFSLVDNSIQALVTFDKPLQLDYSYAAGDDPNDKQDGSYSYAAGTKFMLEYGGPGELWGFPWEPEPGCDQAVDDCRWISKLTLKSGVVLSDGSNSYIVKPIESEQTMLPTAANACSTAGLSVANVALPLPSGVDGLVSISWVDKPNVTDAPAVIEGELQ